MSLSNSQKEIVDSLIAQGKKAADIYTELIRDHGAEFRDVEVYVTEEQTLQGRLNSITRIAKKIKTAGTEDLRNRYANQIEKIAKSGIKLAKELGKKE